MSPKSTTQAATALPLFPTARTAYADIRNFLAGRHVGATRDDALLEEVLKCVFVRMDSKNSSFLADCKDASDIDLAKRYREVFRSVRSKYSGIFSDADEILLGPESIKYVHESLGRVDLFNGADDPIGDLFQAFIGGSIRGAAGQFFTPAVAVSFLVDALDIRPGDRVIDPACGAGGFLALAAKRKLAAGAKPEDVAKEVVGVEKDRYLARMARIHLAVTLNSEPTIWCADSLSWTPDNGDSGSVDVGPKFDAVITNPPFGSKIVAASESVQRTFDLGFKWSLDRKTGEHVRTDKLTKRVPPQVLFIERCLGLLKPGGRLGIVVPESMMSGRAYRHVVKYLRERAELRAVVGMPESLFKTSGKGGTHTKTCLLIAVRTDDKGKTQKHSTVFMAEAKWCGHDSRGRLVPKNDIPAILQNYSAFSNGGSLPQDHCGYALSTADISDNILAPRYYNPEVTALLERLDSSHELIRFGDLVDQGVLSVSTGHEVGKLAYGTGNIPFVRTSDISNWEIKIDPKHGLSEEIFQKYQKSQNVRAGDILMVRDGTYLIGTCAFITGYDERIVYQSHIYKIRVEKPDAISPHLLLALLSSPVVKIQIKAKRFTQDIIDSLGDRLNEIILPVPKDRQLCEGVASKVKRAIEERIEARELARAACSEVLGPMWGVEPQPMPSSL